MTRRADADRLAALLESAGDQTQATTTGAVVTEDADEQALLLLASALRDAAPPVEPMRAEFRAELRERVIQAARENQPEPALLTRLRDRTRRMRYSTGFATGSGIAAMALSGGGVAAAAEGAQPGQLLYPVKIGIEEVRLALTFDDVAAGERAVAYAFDRLTEAELAASEGDDAAAATALRGAADRMVEGTDHLAASGLVDPMLRLAEDVAAQQRRLDRLIPLLGAEGSVAANGLADALDDAREAIAVVTVPGVDALEVPDPPSLPVPTQSTTTTPVPEVSTPPVPATPEPTPSALPTIPSDQVPLPVPLPDPPPVTVPDVDDAPVPLPDSPSAGDLGGAVEESIDEAVDAIGTAVEDLGATPGAVVDEAVGAVTEPVTPLLPSAVETVTDAVGDVIDGAESDAGSDPGGTLGTVEDSVDGVVPDVDDVTSDIIGGG